MGPVYHELSSRIFNPFHSCLHFADVLFFPWSEIVWQTFKDTAKKHFAEFCNLHQTVQVSTHSLLAYSLPASAGDVGLIPAWEDPLEKEMATHSSIHTCCKHRLFWGQESSKASVPCSILGWTEVWVRDEQRSGCSFLAPSQPFPSTICTFFSWVSSEARILCPPIKLFLKVTHSPFLLSGPQSARRASCHISICGHIHSNKEPALVKPSLSLFSQTVVSAFSAQKSLWNSKVNL